MEGSEYQAAEGRREEGAGLGVLVLQRSSMLSKVMGWGVELCSPGSHCIHSPCCWWWSGQGVSHHTVGTIDEPDVDGELCHIAQLSALVAVHAFAALDRVKVSRL